MPKTLTSTVAQQYREGYEAGRSTALAGKPPSARKWYMEDAFSDGYRAGWNTHFRGDSLARQYILNGLHGKRLGIRNQQRFLQRQREQSMVTKR